MSLKLKIPPVVVMLVCGILVWVLDQLVLIDWGSFDVRWWFALVFFAAGTGFSLGGVLSFYRQSTTVNPHKPEQSTALVQSGVYRLSRNPMYLGLLLILVSAAVYFGNPLSLVMALAFVGYMNRYQIEPEEEMMHQKFGTEFRDYCSEVRRWI